MTVLWVAKLANANRYSVILGRGIRTVKSSRALLDSVAKDPAEQLVVIGADVPFADAVAAAFELQNIRASLGVVLVSERPDAATYSKAMSSGMRFVVMEGDAAELQAATVNSLAMSARLQAAPSEPVTQKQGRLVMVFSAKGGCGKTTVSTNLAVALAADDSKRVCLVDLDLQFGDVAIALNLEPRRTIVDALPLAENLTGPTLAKVLTKHKPNLQVLLAPIDPAHIESITPALVGGLLKALKQEFDYVVVDTPPAITEVIIEAIDLADDCVLLTTLDAPSIKNLKLAMATLIGLEVPREKWRVVANQCAPDSGISVPELERAIGMPAAIAIPESRLVAQSVNLGKAALELNPLDPASVALQLLARKLEANFEDEKPRSLVSYLRPILNAKWVVNR